MLYNIQVTHILFLIHKKTLQFNSREMFVLNYSDFARIIPVYNDISKSS